MATSLIPAGTAAASSDDLTVNNGKKITVFLRDPEAGAQVEYYLKDSAATYQLQDTLDESNLAVALETGVYQFRRVDTGAEVAVDYELDEIYAGFVAGPSSTFTRPADTTAYAAGDLVANSTTAGSVTALSWTVSRVTGRGASCAKARLRKSGTSVTNAAFRLHLYSTAPTVTNGDNGAWLSNNSANYLGSITIGSMLAFSDGAVGTGSSDDMASFIFTTDTVYGLLEARGAYTPSSGETFAVALALVQN